MFCKELISIIVPVYNAEAYIENCITSMLNQTYDNFELLLINDGSKDDSLSMCLKYAERDNRIKVYDKPNGGASSARNLGLKYVKGQYIVFVDIDDFLSRNYLENLYSAAKEGNYDIVQCNYEIVNNQYQEEKYVGFNKNDIREITKVQALNNRLYKVTLWGKIYSLKLFKNFRFKEGIIYEDDASYYIFIDRANKIAVLDETLYYYYMSSNSVMRNENEMNMDFIDIYNERINYFKKRNNIELLEGTYNRYCLVLMLAYSSCIYLNKNNVNKILDIYKEIYKKVKKSKYLRARDKIMYKIFNISPKLIGKMIGKIRKKLLKQ